MTEYENIMKMTKDEFADFLFDISAFDISICEKLCGGYCFGMPSLSLCKPHILEFFDKKVKPKKGRKKP